ncbi:MAG: bifunctional adenosylcobinamide kinase/adenosylcobinamide-phosphate guanylyltransferase, partial [Steroidobacteraceae bacterium]
MARHLIIGGARSGKSALARRLADESGLPVSLIATARAGDAEMSDRILRHRDERPSEWRTVEEPLDLASALAWEARRGCCVVIDCLTLWLTNCLLEDGLDQAESAALSSSPLWQRQRASFLSSLAEAEGEVVLVS